MNRQAGLSVVEVLISCILIVPLILVATSTGKLAVGSMAADDRASEAAQLVHGITKRLDQLFRSGLRSTCQMRAEQSDVDAAVAAGETPPSIGDWITAPELSPRSGICMRSTEGVQSLLGAAVTASRCVEFVIDDNETDNDVDDDGDGLVDEGALRFESDGIDFDLATDLEGCTFELDGDVLRIGISFARRDALGRVFRTFSTYSIWMRNP